MKIIIPLLMACCILSCTPKYKPLLRGHGYSEYKTAKDMYFVQFHHPSNNNHHHELIHRYFLRRAAELTLQSGYTHFMVLDSVSQTTTSANITHSNAHYSRGDRGTVKMLPPEKSDGAYDAKIILEPFKNQPQ